MAEPKNTYYDYTFEDGDSVKMTLAFYALYQLKSINKGLYDKYNKVMTHGPADELEMLTVLYAAYICANISNPANCMSEEDFIVKCGSDRMAVKKALEKLIKPKKQ